MIAAQFLQRRHDLSLTQQQVADRANVDQGDISRFERGLHHFNQATLERLADAVDCDVRLVPRGGAR